MSKYIITFSKNGNIKYTSHLDINRMFRRILRKIGIQLEYSQGFNPHPKMNFAQPLSLGYEANNEMLEITTKENYKPWFIESELSSQMPMGIKIVGCQYADDSVSSLAALANQADFIIRFQYDGEKDLNKCLQDYLGQKEILIEKLNKKKKPVTINIREKIQSIGLVRHANGLVEMKMKLDCGSASNLSPEYVISTFFDFADVDVKRENVDVTREKIHFSKNVIKD